MNMYQKLAGCTEYETSEAFITPGFTPSAATKTVIEVRGFSACNSYRKRTEVEESPDAIRRACPSGCPLQQVTPLRSSSPATSATACGPLSGPVKHTHMQFWTSLKDTKKLLPHLTLISIVM